MQIYIQRNLKTNELINDALKIYCVVNGYMDVSIYEKSYKIKEEEILILNQGHRCTINSSKDSIIFVIEIENTEQMEVGKGIPTFICGADRFEEEAKALKYLEVFDICKRAIIRLCKKGLTKVDEKSYGYQILAILEENFSESDDIVYSLQCQDDRIATIHKYINEHLADDISMSKLAEMVYVSKATLSRHFKKAMGIGFAEYLIDLRVKHGKRLLKYTDKPILNIAVDCGFANASAFTNNFKLIEKITPSEYRKQCASNKDVSSEQVSELYSDLIKELGYEKEEYICKEKEEYKVVVDAREYTDIQKTWNLFMNLGTADDIINSNVQSHVIFLKKELNFKYGRVWGIFSKKMCVSDGFSTGVYNFDRLDMTLDFLVNNDIIPFIDFGLRPNTAIIRPGQPIFYEDDYVEFKSFKVWQDLIKDFILHIRNRYGILRVSEWMFEFTWPHMVDEKLLIMDEKAYCKNFCELYRTIKSLTDNAAVGGPMCHLGLDRGFIRRFLSYLSNEGCNIDFLSFMLFPYEGKENHTEEKVVDADFERQQVNQIKHLIESFDNLNCKIFITEWNNTLSNRDFLNDSCYRMTYFVSRLEEIAHSVDGIGIWTASDWTSSYFDTRGILNGSSGLISKDIIPKPSFYGIKFMNMLGEKIIYKDSNVIASATNNNSFYILFFYHKQMQLKKLINSEVIKRPADIEGIHDENIKKNVTLMLENVQLGRYAIKKRIVNKDTGNILNHWSKFNYEIEIQRDDISYIKAITVPELRMEYKKVESGTLTLQQEMSPYEIVLWHIYPV